VTLFNVLSVYHKLKSVKQSPFSNQLASSPRRNIPGQQFAAEGERSLFPLVLGMKVRWRMIAKKNSNHYSKEC
jgi:hypothetical protein